MGRKELARKTFIQGGASLPTAEKLSRVVETTASRRGRIEPDIIAAVCDPGYFLDQGTCKKTIQVSQPPPNIFAPPAPPPPPSKESRTVPGLVCNLRAPKQSYARGVTYPGCPGKPGYYYVGDFTEDANSKTELAFTNIIRSNQAALRAAGYRLPPSQKVIGLLAARAGQARTSAVRACKTSYTKGAKTTKSAGCVGAMAEADRIQKMLFDYSQQPYGFLD